MGTRGFVTFVIDGQEKTAYSHCDSYPEKVGLQVLRWARAHAQDREILTARVRALRVVSPDSKPPVRVTRELRRFAGGPGKPGTWYHLLRETQGEPGLILLAGVVEDASGFPGEPQALWGYVIDVDAGRLEVYRGGHLAYWPPALVASWPFGALPANAAEFTEACYGPEAGR